MPINNPSIFNAAFVGAMTGVADTGGAPSTVAAHYNPISNQADAFATEFDSLIPTIPSGPSEAQLALIESLSNDYFAFFEASSGSVTPIDYAHAAAVVLAEYTSANALIIPEAPVTPPFTPVTQANWYIDEQNSTGLASDSNTGATALTPLLTDAERQRRWGLSGRLTQARYDLYYLSQASTVLLLGTREQTCAGVWMHGSATPFQGQSIIVGPATMTARTLIVEATNTRASQTGGTANAHISTAGAPNSRIRFVAGPSAGLVAWPQKTGGGTICFVSQWYTPSVFDPVTFNLPPNGTPTVNDTYVIEALGVIDKLIYNIICDNDGNNGFFGLICDSLHCNNCLTLPGTDSIAFLGCSNIGMANANGTISIQNNCILIGCETPGNPISPGATPGLFLCHITGTFFPSGGSTVSFFQRCISQGVPALNTSGVGVGFISNLGVFDSTSDGVQATDGDIVYGGALWGSGNTAAGHSGNVANGIINTADGGTVAQLTIAGASDFKLGGKTVARAFNEATGVYTATRNTTWANLAASVATTGFGGNAEDVGTGAAIQTTA